MATDTSSPPRFFHMPRFQHQAPRQLFYKRPDFAQQQAMQQLTFDGKRMRKAVNRKTIDYNPSVIRHLENRLWQRDHRDFRAIQPDAGCYNDLVPPVGILSNPMNAVTTKFVRTSTNKVKCPVFVIRWTPEGRRLVTGASSGEFTLWNGLTFNFETILQAHDSPVRAMTWSHNDMWMLTADHGGYVKYWQSNMNNVKMFQAHKEAIREASFSPTDNKFATCSDDGTVRIWDFLRCHEERILRGHGADVKCVDWHPTKGLVVSGSKDSQQPIKFWDPKTGQSLATLHAHKNTVMEVKWNLNGNWLLTASRDHLCKLFDIRNLKEELQVFRGHKKEATAVAWHPVHEGLFASGGSDGSLLFWNVGVEKEVGGMEMAHEGMIWSLAWHPLGHILCSGSNDHTSKFWTRNRPGDKMRDRYNLNLLPGMSEDGVEYDDMEPNSLAAIPGMGIPDQLKAAMEQEASDKETAAEEEMSIPGLDWGIEEILQKDQKKVPQKKVPYAKPIPAQFQQAWADNKVPLVPPGGEKKERMDEKKMDGKTNTNPMMLEQMKMDRMNQMDGNMPPPGGPQGPMPPFPGQGGTMPPPPQGFPQSMPPQQMPHNMGPPMGPGVMQAPFMRPGQMGPPPGSQHHQGPPQGMMGPPDLHGPQGMQRHPGPHRNMGPQGPHGMPPGPRGMQGPPGNMQGPPPGGMMGPPPRGQGPPPQGGMMPPQGNMMGPQGPMQGGVGMGPPMQNPTRTHGNMGGMGGMHGMGNMQGPPPGNMQGPPPGNMQGPPGNMQGPPGNMQGPPGNMQGPPSYMQHQVGQNTGPMMHGMGQQGPNGKDTRGPPTTTWVLHLGVRGRAVLGALTRALVLTGETLSRGADPTTSMKVARTSTDGERRAGGEGPARNTREATEEGGKGEGGGMGETGALLRKDSPVMGESSEAAGTTGLVVMGVQERSLTRGRETDCLHQGMARTQTTRTEGVDRVALGGGGSLMSLVGRKRTLTPQMRWPEVGTTEGGGDPHEEGAHPEEEEVVVVVDARACSPPLMSSPHTMREAEVRRPGRAGKIKVTRHTEKASAPSTARCTTARPLPAVSAPPPCRAWTWPRCPHANGRGTTARAPETKTPREQG
ncbi:pre-mRNA 3' end processing protein WDR33 isoform X2 [Oncorhynchus keta]|uniref:pre-mRNA 3' end processing protein WDR33 isoform X2 n=1 Tax=Oncorhynchus keta TaxID=8018 RepID=UPI00227AEC6C|nr:pre-mRNA 3' end processing protein WDR33 isoform X2 [Oncorhynchus keta]